MNRIHRVVWNAVKGCYVAANEATGTAQARGKVAAVALAVAAVLSMPAGAASVSDGALSTDDGKSVVLIHDNLLNEDGSYQGMDFSGYTNDDLSGLAENAQISSVAEAVTDVFVAHDRTLNIVGDNIDINANLFSVVDTGRKTQGYIRIGTKGDVKTTGSFGTISVGLPDLDTILGKISVDSHEAGLLIENADVSIEKLRTATATTIESDAKVSIGTWQAEALGNVAMIGGDTYYPLTNRGDLTIAKIETSKNSADHFASPGSVLVNEGTVHIGETEGAHFGLHNEAGATASVDSFVLSMGDLTNDTNDGTFTFEDSYNRGTMTVADRFVINGADQWGNNADIFGVFRNFGSLSVGTAEQVATEIAVNGQMYNDGASAQAVFNGDLIVADTNGADSFETLFSNTNGASVNVTGDLTIESGNFVNRNATITVGGTFDSKIDIENQGVIQAADEGAQLTIDGTTFTNSAAQEAVGSVKGFNVEVVGNGTFNLAGGSADLTGLTLTAGTAYIAETASDDTVNLGAVTIAGNQALHVAGDVEVTTLSVAAGAAIDQDLFDSETLGSGLIKATGSVTNEGSITLDELETSSYSDTADATADFGKLTLAGGEIAGQVKAGELILGNGTDAAQLNVSGSDTEAEAGNLRVTSSVVVTKEANITIAAEDGQTASMKVVGQSGTSEVDGILQIAGTVAVGQNGTLYAEGVTLDGGALGVTGSSAQTDSLSATAAGGTINLSQGGKLTVAGGSTAGITFNFNGAGTEVDFGDSGKWFEHATINLNNRNWNLTGSDGDGFGENTVNINDGSTVSYTDNAVLKNNSTITVNEGAVLDADRIGFEDRYSGSLTLAGGTLVTSLDQIFSEVRADEFIEGTDLTTGEIIQIPVSGIQSVGAVKGELTGSSGIIYESGIFEFTDDGWTINAVNSASSQLQNAFEKFTGAEGTLVFSGTEDSESGAFSVADANGLNSNIVLAGTILDAAGDVTFGNAAEFDNVVTVETTGFQAIANADKVTVTDGHHLYLVGFEGDQGTGKLLTTAENGTIDVNNGSLTLGLDGKQTGGKVETINLSNGSLEVAAGGFFGVDSLTSGENGVITVDAGSSLKVGYLSDSESSETTVNGALEINDPVSLAGKLVNNGTVTTAGTGSFADLTNSGTLKTAGAFTSQKTVNNGVIESTAEAAFGTLENKGSVTGTAVVIGTDSAAGTLTNDVGASITATAEGVNMVLAGQNTNAGNIEGATVSVKLQDGAQLVNSGAIKATGEEGITLSGSQTAKFTNSGSLETSRLAVESIAFETTSEIAADQVSVTGSAFTVADTGAVKADTLTITNSEFVNNGSIELAAEDNALSIVGGTFTNNGAVKAADLALSNNAVMSNNGTLTVTDLSIENGSSITQTDEGVVSTQNLTVVGDMFDLGSGTWVIGSDTGINFINEDGDPVAATVNVTSGKELVTANADVDNITYNVTKTLTFGTTAGIADNLGIENVNGILTVDKGVEIGATGSIQVGSADTADTTRAPGAAFTAEAGSVTIFTGNAFGADGTEAGILAEAEGLTAVIDQDAKAVLTGIQHSGSYKLLEGFDLSANLDAETGEWIGGWTGENGQYVTVDNGSDLEWKVDVAYDKDGNAIVVDTVAADVRSVYNFATPDIANAALASGADASKGADIAFMQAVINNKDLNVAQTERIVNSVTQIAASLGTAANFLNDASGLMDSVESRTSLLSDADKESGLWVRMEGGKYKMDGLEIAGGQDAGYDTNTYGVTFGADTLVKPDLRIGAAFSYLNGSADADGDVLSGTNDYDTYGLQAYAAYDVSETMRISGEIGWFHSSAELSQKISFADVRKAEADVDTDAFTLGIRGDWRFDVNGFTVVPHVGLRGIYMMNDDFTTEIDGKKAFENDQDDTFTVQIPVGVAVEKAFATASGWNVVPSADFTVAPQFGDTEYDTTVTGVGTGVSQAVTADMAGDILGRVSFGVKADNGTSSFGAYYGFTAGDAGRQDHAFNLSFSYRF